MTMDKPLTNQDATPETKDTTAPEAQEPLADKESSPEKAEPTPSTPPKIHTEDEIARLIQLAKMDRGREIKEAQVERDSYKSKLESQINQYENVLAERDKLQADIEALSSNDPKKFDIVSRDKALKERERELQAKMLKLEAERQAHEANMALANATMREIAAWEVAADYVGGDPMKLKNLSELMNATTKEQIAKLADTLWDKKPAGNKKDDSSDKSKEPAKPVTPFSGRTSGGSRFIYDRKNPNQTLVEGFKSMNKK